MLWLAAGFAVVGAAFTVAGLVPIIDGTASQQASIDVMCVVAGVACLALAGYFGWGYGWLRRRPELVARVQRGGER